MLQCYHRNKRHHGQVRKILESQFGFQYDGENTVISAPSSIDLNKRLFNFWKSQQRELPKTTEWLPCNESFS